MGIFPLLGPGRPTAGGPRMDRQAVTSLGVVKISRFAPVALSSERNLSNSSTDQITRQQKRDSLLAPNDPSAKA